MSKIASGIKPGVAVEQGQVIGYVGSTGLATGPHVCYRFWKDGKQVDPYKENIPKAAPLEEEELPSYLNFIESLNQKLDSISLNDTSQEIVI
jgi:murein DD-endopeptidase MepM/ murein hydrolase activator NlpD